MVIDHQVLFAVDQCSLAMPEVHPGVVAMIKASIIAVNMPMEESKIDMNMIIIDFLPSLHHHQMHYFLDL